MFRVAVPVWRLPSLLTQSWRRMLHANAHTLHLGRLHPYSYAPGLPGRGGRRRAGSLRSGWEYRVALSKKYILPHTFLVYCVAWPHIPFTPPAGVPRNLRNDLLVAADSITNTMSSLVKELHSGLLHAAVRSPRDSSAPRVPRFMTRACLDVTVMMCLSVACHVAGCDSKSW